MKQFHTAPRANRFMDFDRGSAAPAQASGLETVSKSLENPGKNLVEDIGKFKDTLVDHTKDVQSKLLKDPSDKQALDQLAMIRKNVERLLDIKNRFDGEKMVLNQSSRLARAEFRGKTEIENAYIETQGALAALDAAVLEKKLATKEGWNSLTLAQKIAYFSNLDGEGGTQESNKVERGGFLWLSKTNVQKFIVRETQVERAMTHLAGGNAAAFEEMVQRIGGEPLTKDNYQALRAKFTKNVLERTQTMAILTRGMGEEFQAGLISVLSGHEAAFIQSIESSPKFKENLAKGIDAMKSAGWNSDRIIHELQAMGVSVAAASLGLVGTLSKSEAGAENGLLTGTLVSNEKGDKNLKLKATLLLPSVEGQINWNDRNGVAQQIRKDRGTIVSAMMNGAKDGFDAGKVAEVIKKYPNILKQPQIDEIYARVAEFNDMTKAMTPEQKKRFMAAVREQWIESDIANFAGKNSGWGVEGVGVGVLLFFPFIKLNFQNISQSVKEGKRNLGTELDARASRKNKNLAELGIVSKEAGDKKLYTFAKNNPYSISEEAAKAGVTYDEATKTLTAPKNVGLSFSLDEDTKDGETVLMIDLSGGKADIAAIPDTNKDADLGLEKLNLSLKDIIDDPKVRVNLSALATLSMKARHAAEHFSKVYAEKDLRNDADIAAIKKAAIDMLMGSNLKNLRALARKLKNETKENEVQSTLTSLRYALMTDLVDAQALFHKPRKIRKGEESVGKRFNDLVEAKHKSPISGESLVDALKGTGLNKNDFQGIVSKEENWNTHRCKHEPDMIALVGTWKFKPANLTYAPPGTVEVATSGDEKKEYIKKVDSLEKKKAIYEAFVKNDAFRKHELVNIQNAISNAAGCGCEAISPDVLESLVTTGKADFLGGTLTLSESEFSLFAYGACANPSMGLKLGKGLRYHKPGQPGKTVDVAYDQVSAPVGSQEVNNLELGIGAMGKSLKHEEKRNTEYKTEVQTRNVTVDGRNIQLANGQLPPKITVIESGGVQRTIDASTLSAEQAQSIIRAIRAGNSTTISMQVTSQVPVQWTTEVEPAISMAARNAAVVEGAVVESMDTRHPNHMADASAPAEKKEEPKK